MNLQEWRKQYSKRRAIADRITESRLRRLREMTKNGSLDPSIMGIHLNNAMVSYNNGQPWPNVDYEIIKKAHYLEKSGWLWEASRIVEKWDKRVRGF